MAHGFKDDKGKFHPINNNSPTKKKIQGTIKIADGNHSLLSHGVKLDSNLNFNNPANQEIIKGFETAMNKDDFGVAKQIKELKVENQKPTTVYEAQIHVEKGKIWLPKKEGATFGDYEALTVHELAHQDLDNKIKAKNPRIPKYFKNAVLVKPFTSDLIIIAERVKDAYEKGDDREVDELLTKYVEEIHSNTAEMTEREKFSNLENRVLDREEFEKAKKIYRELHTED